MNISRVIISFCFAIFIGSFFVSQKTVVLIYQDRLFPVLTYARTVSDLFYYMNKPYLNYHLTKHKTDDHLRDGLLLELDIWWEQ